jgi:hypothetical protein
MTGSVTPGLIDAIEPAVTAEPVVGLAVFAGFVIGRELLDDRQATDA